jgi:hypothetical protein
MDKVNYYIIRRSIQFCATLLFAGFFADLPAQYRTGEDLIAEMHKRYYQAPCRSYKFSQRNRHYENDSLTRRTEWHEAVSFPDKFRITFGGRNSGNYVLFRNDSTMRYFENKHVKSKPDSNNLLLLLGGMYYRDLPDVKARLNRAGYDLSRISIAKWMKDSVFVLGALKGDTTSNQLWVNKRDLVIVRIIERINPTEMMDMRFEAYRKWCRGHVETRVSFRRNGRLEQEEEYYDLTETDGFSLTD